MANEEAVPWMVTLRRADWDGVAAVNDPMTNTGSFTSHATLGTVWSIDGKAADPSGSWNGRMYDDGDPSSDVPTVAVGVFSSAAGSTHSMVGGFGATKD